MRLPLTLLLFPGSVLFNAKGSYFYWERICSGKVERLRLLGMSSRKAGLMQRGMNVPRPVVLKGLSLSKRFWPRVKPTWNPPVSLPIPHPLWFFPLPVHVSAHDSPESAGFRFDFRWNGKFRFQMFCWNQNYDGQTPAFYRQYYKQAK